MTVIINTPEAIEKMRIAGKLAAEVLDMITPHVQAGISTEELDKLCHDYIVDKQQAIPACLNYRGYPKTICTSINHQVCHGIPGPKKLKNGDIMNLDVTVKKDGYFGDTSKMFIIGNAGILAERLVKITQECMYAGIKVVRAGAHLGDIGAAIQKIAHKNHFSVVEDFCGHGIGAVFHDEPQVLHYGKAGTGIELKAGMIFTIEPMINAGKVGVKIIEEFKDLYPNNTIFPAVTRDRSLSAQWEHTILVTETGYQVLTLRDEEKGSI